MVTSFSESYSTIESRKTLSVCVSPSSISGSNLIVMVLERKEKQDFGRWIDKRRISYRHVGISEAESIPASEPTSSEKSKAAILWLESASDWTCFEGYDAPH